MDKNYKWKNKYRFVYIKIEKYPKAGVGRRERQSIRKNNIVYITDKL